jgi:hypothetical protein
MGHMMMAGCDEEDVCSCTKDSECNKPQLTTNYVTIDEEFKCFNCQENIMLLPVFCSEGHTFCKLCIEKWLRYKDTTCSPVDREALSASELTRSRPLEKVICMILSVFVAYDRASTNIFASFFFLFLNLLLSVI